MSNPTVVVVESLFKELDDFIHKSDYQNAISICDKILKIDANDPEAFYCKVICLIHDSKFEDALILLNSNKTLSQNLIFERAYCFYRTKKLNEALSLLQDNNNFPIPKPKKVLELEAQVYYRLEDFGKCVKVYEQLQQDFKIDSPEMLTNLMAAYISGESASDGEKLVVNYKSNLQSNFEFAYNAACISIEAENFDTAEKYLLLSQKICKDSLAEEKATDEQIQDELSVIFAQLGYVKQLQNKTEEAIELYNQVLKSKPSDESISAVASNNMVAIKKEHDLLDSFGKLKQATSQIVEQKLSINQKKNNRI